MLLGVFQKFERRADMITTTRGAKREMILETVNRLPQRFQIGEK